MKEEYIWWRGEKWEFVKWLCRAKDDKWILVKKRQNTVTDNGHECYEWNAIDCGNEEWLWSNTVNDRLYNSLYSAQIKVEEINRKISNKWCGIE